MTMTRVQSRSTYLPSAIAKDRIYLVFMFTSALNRLDGAHSSSSKPCSIARMYCNFSTVPSPDRRLHRVARPDGRSPRLCGFDTHSSLIVDGLGTAYPALLASGSPWPRVDGSYGPSRRSLVTERQGGDGICILAARRLFPTRTPSARNGCALFSGNPIAPGNSRASSRVILDQWLRGSNFVV